MLASLADDLRVLSCVPSPQDKSQASRTSLWDYSYEHMFIINWTHIPKNMGTKNEELTFESVGKILQSDHYIL